MGECGSGGSGGGGGGEAEREEEREKAVRHGPWGRERRSNGETSLMDESALSMAMMPSRGGGGGGEDGAGVRSAEGRRACTRSRWKGLAMDVVAVGLESRRGGEWLSRERESETT